MDVLLILLEQIGLFIIYILLGALLIKTKVLTEQTNETLSRFVLKFALPIMIFSNTVSGVDRSTLFSSASILLITVIFYCLTYLLGFGLQKTFCLSGNRGQVYQALAMFGNIGFMGIPIISSIFPQKGMLYISVFTIIDQLVLWTVGVKLTTPRGKGKFDPLKLINPSSVAIFLAVLFIVLNIQIPLLGEIALQKIGATATPLAMIYLGGVFSCIDITHYIKIKEFYGIVFIKMILFPILFYLLLELFQIPDEIHLTMALLSALPAMSSIVMMAKASQSEGDYAMGGIFVTTICSIFSLPFVCWIFQCVL